MEKHQDTKDELSFSIQRDITWRNSLEDVNIPFTDVIPEMKEYEEKDIK